MALKTYKPTTPTLRHTIRVDRSALSKKKPLKALTKGKKAISARNNKGRITVRHRGGGVKRKYRIIDFKRNKRDVPAKVVEIAYDPNRSANIALVQYIDGEKRYILAPKDLKIGQEIISSEEAPPKVGNSVMLKNIPVGIFVHNIELTPGKGGQIVRSAGSGALVQGNNGKGYVQLKMPSGEVRLVNEKNWATIGEVGNEDHSNTKLGKAGAKRKLGFRPAVRGMAMHAKQHPHGAGEGKGQVGTSGGKRGPEDIYGNRIGRKTRRIKRTNKFIIKRRTTRRRPKAKKLN